MPAFADTLTGKVVKITDGDTLYVLDANHIVTELFIRSFLSFAPLRQRIVYDLVTLTANRSTVPHRPVTSLRSCRLVC